MTNEEKIKRYCKSKFLPMGLITRDDTDNNIKETTFPTRREALYFFMVAVEKYD